MTWQYGKVVEGDEEKKEGRIMISNGCELKTWETSYLFHIELLNGVIYLLGNGT